jgi:hypothetical protein
MYEARFIDAALRHSCVSPSSYTSRITLVQISFSPADLDSILRARSGSHQSPELLEDP